IRRTFDPRGSVFDPRGSRGLIALAPHVRPTWVALSDARRSRRQALASHVLPTWVSPPGSSHSHRMFDARGSRGLIALASHVRPTWVSTTGSSHSRRMFDPRGPLAPGAEGRRRRRSYPISSRPCPT